MTMPSADLPEHGIEGYRTPDRLQARIALHERYGPAGYDFHREQFTHILTRLAAGATEGLAADVRVLEVGTGTGRFWRVNAERVPASWDLTLTDLSAGMVAEALRTLEASGLRGGVVEANASDLPFDDASFDLVIANHMLYHVPDLNRAVAEFRRVLRPRGVLYAATNGREHLARLRSELFELNALAPELSVASIDRLRFDLENGDAILQRAFRDVKRFDRVDRLEVDEVEPLMAHLWSMIDVPEPAPPGLEERLMRWDRATRERFERELMDGPVTVGRVTGYFVAS